MRAGSVLLLPACLPACLCGCEFACSIDSPAWDSSVQHEGNLMGVCSCILTPPFEGLQSVARRLASATQTLHTLPACPSQARTRPSLAPASIRPTQHRWVLPQGAALPAGSV